jgi:hypothetical protein
LVRIGVGNKQKTPVDKGAGQFEKFEPHRNNRNIDFHIDHVFLSMFSMFYPASSARKVVVQKKIIPQDFKLTRYR